MRITKLRRRKKKDESANNVEKLVENRDTEFIALRCSNHIYSISTNQPSMASSSSSSSQSWSHEVFLSFRGEDTRKNFVDHLYSALVQQGVDTYKDDETLRQGESIRPSLMNAIQESQIAVIIFSKNYADSSWCLDELAHIMECKDKRGQIVLPIFYDVDPSDVRKQKRKYGEAFAKHELENKDKVISWRKALVDASNLSGWEPKNIANGHESKVIREIVNKILSRLLLVTASANEKLIGMAARVQHLKSELQIGLGGVRMIGIWGVGGGGKTTLASITYDQICRKFDGCCFLANIREESRKHGLEKLQKEVLSKMEANNSGGGRCLIGTRLRNRKVLIVLDDVDQLDQLEKLAESPDWFGEGSRIIITTRDEHLLKAHKVVVHDISLLHADEAIELFRKHAFQGDIPSEDYDRLSKEVVSYAGGLPLALKVLGSSLCDKNIDQWRSALARLKEIPDDKILEKLKISFDGLTKIQKDLFLDIACFFREGNKDEAMETLEACGFHPVVGVEELRQKALITISDGMFDMHDLVQEMGHHIVRGEHPKNPEKHSRIWKREDLLTICAMDATMELDKIEAIQVIPKYHEKPPPPIIANMRNLRYIERFGDPANPLLNNFPPTGLCCLILVGAIQDRLWNGYKYLPNLKIMQLSVLDNLIMTPDFEGIPNLERFEVFFCPKLEEIHSSIGGLEKLVFLSIQDCSSIKKFPSITRLKKLETLLFRECPGLFELSDIQQKMDNLGDEDINSVIRELSNLNHISLCFSLKYLKKLNLSWCNLGDEYMSSAVWELPALQELNLSRNKFSKLNFSLIRTPRLKVLNVRHCENLVELSELPSSIAVLNANYCTSLEKFGDISNCKWLWNVTLDGATKVCPLDGYKLLNFMLKGNALEDHFISVTLEHDIPKGIVGRLFMGDKFTLCLPPCDSYNDFYGFLIHVVTDAILPTIQIIIKQEQDEDPSFELLQESNEELEPEYRRKTYVGYVSFNSLRHIACLNSTYNVISISSDGHVDRIGATLVPRKSKDDAVQTTKVTTEYSELYEEYRFTQAFTIKHDSKSSINILWRPR
ncbi:hypothetical protein L2E82_21546 [Cichorium intybus]|uniref:Uncharacterized protein n=1 Tax=Cichorium intybus TaxID=13427 RepID=A0ACB9DW31_CICIN|nr:hypothetical protein L2E82_21546 [Cichorium intybus]